MRFQLPRPEPAMAPPVTALLAPPAPQASATNSPAAQPAPGTDQPEGPTVAPDQWLAPGPKALALPPVATPADSTTIGAINAQSVIGLLRAAPTNSVPEQFVPPAFVPPPPPQRSSTATYEVR